MTATYLDNTNAMNSMLELMDVGIYCKMLTAMNFAFHSVVFITHQDANHKVCGGWRRSCRKNLFTDILHDK